MLIDYQKVNIYQQSDNIILSEIDFCVNEGEFIYIIGKVGSGKSSLLKSIYLELDINEAETAIVLEHDICDLKRKHIPALRKQMGIIFQDFQLLSDRNVRKNLMFVLKATGWKDSDDINNRIEEVLTEVDMLHKADVMPYELSGGEQQRIAIARAILNNPKLIIADEPTGNLDPETADNIVKLLRHFTEKGTSVVMSTHNINMLDKYPGIVYRCADGKIERINQPNIPEECESEFSEQQQVEEKTEEAKEEALDTIIFN